MYNGKAQFSWNFNFSMMSREDSQRPVSSRGAKHNIHTRKINRTI